MYTVVRVSAEMLQSQSDSVERTRGRPSSLSDNDATLLQAQSPYQPPVMCTAADMAKTNALRKRHIREREQARWS